MVTSVHTARGTACTRTCGRSGRAPRTEGAAMGRRSGGVLICFAPSVSRLACYGPITLVASSIGEVRRGRLRISPQVACLHRVALVRPRRWRLSRPVAATTPRFGRPTRRGVGDEAPRQCAPARENGGWALDFGSRPDAAIHFSIRCSTRSTTSPRKTSPTIADPGLPNLLTGELSWRIRRCPRGSRA